MGGVFGGGGGGGQQVVNPVIPDEQKAPFLGGTFGGGNYYQPTPFNYPGIAPEATNLYQQGPPDWPGPQFAPETQGEAAYLKYIMGAAPNIRDAGRGMMDAAARAAGTTSPQGQAAAKQGIGAVGNILGQPAFQDYQNYGNWRETAANAGAMAPNAGQYATLGNVGNWAGTVAQQGTGQINPYINPWVDAAQNQAFRGAGRAAGLTQDTFNLGARTARDEFDRSALGAVGSYQRATQPALNDITDQLSTLSRDFQEQILPSIRGSASSVGGYGGSRQGIAEGIAARGVGEQMARSIGRVGEGFGLGGAQMGEALGLGASQLGGNLGLGARQGAMDVYRLGSQAAEQAGDIGAGMYGSAFENAQGRALNAAGLGLNASQTQAGLQQQGIQNNLDAFENAQQRRLSGAELGAQMAAQQEAHRQSGMFNQGQLGINLGTLGRGLIGDAQNYSISGMNAMPGAIGAYMQPIGMLGNAGNLQRQIAQGQIADRTAQANYPYQQGWQHLQNYANIMNASRPGALSPQITQSGTSPLGGMFSGGVSGAGIGVAAGAAAPWTWGLGAAGALGGLLGG